MILSKYSKNLSLKSAWMLAAWGQGSGAVLFRNDMEVSAEVPGTEQVVNECLLNEWMSEWREAERKK